MVELVDKVLDILERVGRAAPCSLRDISEECRIPVSTAFRIVDTLTCRGYLVAEKKGRYCLGSRWREVGENSSWLKLLEEVGRRPLMSLARAARAHAHLAVLDGDMVTYLVKQRYGRGDIHSAENIQLEAYCTAIGKMLLAHLEPSEQNAYLTSAPFIRLTSATIIEPRDISSTLYD